MKKILSLAVLLMTAFVGFTACSDDESDGVKSLSKTTFSTTQHVSDATKTGDVTYTVSFNSDSECVMRIESRNMKLLNVDKLYNDDVFYGGTYTKNGNNITFNVDCITTEGVAHPYSIIDRHETRTFTYNSDTKVLTTAEGVELSSVKYSHLECKQYTPSNADETLTLDDLVGGWFINDCLDGYYVTLYMSVEPDGNALICGPWSTVQKPVYGAISANGKVAINGKTITIGTVTIKYTSFSDNTIWGLEIHDSVENKTFKANAAVVLDNE